MIFDAIDLPFLILVPAALALATLVAGLLARRGFPLPAADSRLGCVDGLRGYLALAVAAHHFILWTGLTRLGRPWGAPPFNPWNQLGAGSVALFFMITGLVFYPVILRGWRANSWTGTYIGRVFRIMPLVVVFVALVALVSAARTGNAPEPADLKRALLWLSTWSQPPMMGYWEGKHFNVVWSLWYEWVFYLALLPLLALGRDLIGRRAPTWLLPAAFLVVMLCLRPFPIPRHLPVLLPLFAVGMLAYELREREAARRALATPLASGLAIAALGLGLLIAPTPYGLVPMALFGAFFACVACGNDLFGLLRLRGALVLGECSYSIYLLHSFLVSVPFVEGAPMTSGFAIWQLAALLPAVLLAVTAIAAASYLTIERPAIRLGKAVRRRVAEGGARPRPAELEVAP